MDTINQNLLEKADRDIGFIKEIDTASSTLLASINKKKTSNRQGENFTSDQETIRSNSILSEEFFVSSVQEQRKSALVDADYTAVIARINESLGVI